MEKMFICFGVIAGFFQSVGKPLRYGKEFAIERLGEIKIESGACAGSMTSIKFRIDPSNCAFYPSPLPGYIYLDIDRLPPEGRSGEPKLPVKSFVVELPLGSEIKGVKVRAARYIEIEDSLKIIPNPTPLMRNSDRGGEYIPDKEIYNSYQYFPGRLISFYTGSSKDSTYCFLRFFPVQYIPAKGKAMLVTEAIIEIWYDSPVKSWQRSGPEFQGIIICPEKFLSAAESLKEFHNTSLGVPTEIVTTEWIDTLYEEAPKPPYSGYSQKEVESIRDYSFSLVRRIISYLRDTPSHPNLEYITIIGDAREVPPSYYYTENITYTDAELWAPSDFLYASPDYDFVPNYKVGRISVSDTVEAMVIIRKLKKWYPADWSWFSKAVVAGGDPFPLTLLYYDEALLADCMNREYLSGHNITKCLLSDNRFTSSVLTPCLSDGDLGVFFETGHGSGPAIVFDDGTGIEAGSLLNYPEAENLPLVITPACDVGAFDTDLCSDLKFPVSFGEAVLKSKAGGVCFFGGSRSNHAGFDYYFDEGRLIITDHDYFDRIFTNTIESYHNGAEDLGEIYRKTIFEFVSSEDMEDLLNQWSLFCFTLLGDPALKIPSQVSGENYETPWLSARNPAYLNIKNCPVFHLPKGRSVTVETATNSPSLRYKLCSATWALPALDRKENGKSHSFMLLPEYQFYIVMAESEDRKEGWLYTYAATSNIAVDGDKRDWERVSLKPIASDPDDFSPDDYEIQNLYLTDDEERWYFGFEALSHNTRTTYILAIDYKEGGYKGKEGETQDAFSTWVAFGKKGAFGKAHPIDCEIGVRIYPDGDVFVLLIPWDDASQKWTEWQDWIWFPDSGCIVGYDSTTQFVELGIPLEIFDNLKVLELSLFSAGYDDSLRDYSPALDAAPTDPATYTSPCFGKDYANTITKFVEAKFESTEVGIAAEEFIAEPELVLLHPNPLKNSATIRFELYKKSRVSLKVYDITGRLKKTLISAEKEPGVYEVNWDVESLAPGIYFYRLKTEKRSITRKVILIK